MKCQVLMLLVKQTLYMPHRRLTMRAKLLLLLMKKSILYTVIILLIFSCSSYKKKNDLEGQNIFKNTKPFFKKKSALETKNLFGKVKSYKEFSYKAVEISGEIIKGDRKRQYSSSYDSYIKYDENGNMIEWTNYNSDGSLYIKGSNKLDEKGNCIESVINYANGNLHSKIISKYDDNDNIIAFGSFFIVSEILKDNSIC